MSTSRAGRAAIAQETLAIIEGGGYLLPDGRAVAIGEALEEACAGTALYRPEDYDALLDEVAGLPAFPDASIGVSGRTTLGAARLLVGQYPSVACLNFASAKNPGGGFLGGSQAQEESLARASGLYAALQTRPEFYSHHRQLRTSLYSDQVIFSPGVPVFRDDEDRLLDAPWRAAFITAAAVNAGAVRQNEPRQAGRIVPTLERRARMVLAVAARHRCAALVLGAWGCGVFRNDPATVAAIFARALDEPPFRGRFRHVEFAVYDTSGDRATLTAFERTFGAGAA